ncbi:hypothetical protein CLV44_11064 [Marinobacterium halophilum]|uniref:Uncharacterized protein n=1 Tax=Marinobacterium halophilum TaxID=267374 RepID=A0A2P8EWP5_9GAMM|nr:hypothetical protein [Marinobacterium halophilum]PSL13883.1 hypothetical protein CLV44_11064 [Marinobacterium halophilum]
MVKKIILALVLIPLLAGVFLWQAEPLWWQEAKAEWLADFNADRAEQAMVWREQGLALGRSGDQAACLDRALTDFDGCTGFQCTVNYGRLLNACLETAAISEGFCEGVPAFRDQPTEDDKSWAKYTCWDRNIRGEGCRLLMRQQQLFCSAADGEAVTVEAAPAN